jgi:transposase
VKRRLTRAVAASNTTLTDLYGVGPVIAATVLGYVSYIDRFPTRDHFAAYNGTAPIETSSGNRNIHRLSRRGNRQLNHAVHMAAVSQIRHPGTIGRAYYDRKVESGMGRKAALRALKRRVSDAIYARMITDAQRAARDQKKDPGGQVGTTLHPARPARTPKRRLFGKATPGPPPTLRPAGRQCSNPDRQRTPAAPLDNKEASISSTPPT